ncbi:MAG: hypothetical protein GSR84_03015 [Desulfurococcales archaeon]|nr:hypothetical protein [Desulfurococcales archaeon]
MRRPSTYRRGVAPVVGTIIALAAMILFALIVTQAFDERIRLVEERLERAREDLKITPIVNGTGVYAEVLNRGYVDVVIRHIVVVNRSSGQVVYHATPQLLLSPGIMTMFRLGDWSSGRLDIAVVTQRGSVFRWDPELTIDGVLDLPGEPLSSNITVILEGLSLVPELRGCYYVNSSWISASAPGAYSAGAQALYLEYGSYWAWLFRAQANSLVEEKQWDNNTNKGFPLPINATIIQPPLGLYAAIDYDGGFRLRAEASVVANLSIPSGYKAVVLGDWFTPIEPDAVLYGTRPVYVIEPPWGLAPLNTTVSERSVPLLTGGAGSGVWLGGTVEARLPSSGEALALLYSCP